MTGEVQRHKVVVVGGGFGGLYCAQALGSTPVDVTLIDRRNFHLFQPLLYQVATGALSAANIAAPLRAVVRKQANARTVLAEVIGFDTAGRVVLTADGDAIPYDTLVLATGSTHHYFGHDDWEVHAPGLKTIEDATEIRRRVLMAFEKAEREPDPAARKRMLTFVVIGGGPTGVEMAGSISELARNTMRRDFRAINPADATVILIEGQPRVLPYYHEDLSAKALRYLQQMGVEVVLDSHATAVTADHIVVTNDADPKVERRIDTETLVWAAGVRASPLGKKLAEAFGGGVEVGKAGHVAVGPDCSVPGHPEVFVVGDMASLKGKDGKPLPGVAPVAMQQGKYVAAVIRHRARNILPPDPFQYWDKGSMATVGRMKAVADAGIGRAGRFGGFLAWLAWLFIHVMYLAQFSNRLLVVLQWFYSYVTQGRAARLITGEHQADRTAMLIRYAPPVKADARNVLSSQTPDNLPAPAVPAAAVAN